MKKLTIAQILHIVISECKNSCTGEVDAFNYIMKHYGDQANVREVQALLQILNFAAIRESESILYSMTA